MMREKGADTLLRLGVYSSSDAVRVTVRNVAEEDTALPPGYSYYMPKRTVALTFVVSEMYTHWLLDDMLGVHWLLSHHNSATNPTLNANGTVLRHAVAIVNTAQQSSSHEHMLAEYFTDAPVAKLNDLQQTCFRRLIAGPAQHQLGGPGVYKTTREEVTAFRDSLLRLHKLDCSSSPNRIIIVQRSSGRQLVNANGLFKMLRDAFPGYQVSVERLEERTHAEQLALLCNTAALISTHGSALSNIVFLPPSAHVFEIFPYGFTRPTFQGFAAKMGVQYHAWHNTDRARATFHPEVLEQYRLTPSDRAAIVDAPHYDVKMPWAGNMYWIQQDTRINVKEVVSLVHKSLPHRSSPSVDL
eukprot:TRINITY_DN5768_c0_g1_i1.p1 TRINITY_DN5768_c0_g1~~TRINITY_DN5768_c0_g1_i1.p1  ORF type:complete len:356 (-),score=102.02 TRINITY_DN5768_c0_g1_i1:130-1197(-)